MICVKRKSVRFSDPEEGLHSPSQEGARREEEGNPNAPTTHHSSTSPLRSSAATASSQGRITLPASESVSFRFEGDAEFESDFHHSSSASLSRVHSQTEAEKEKSQCHPETSQGSPYSKKHHLQENHLEELEPEKGSYSIDTRNYLTQQGIVFKPKNPFHQKLITVYAASPLGIKSKDSFQKSKQIVHVQTSNPGKQTASQHAYVVLDTSSKKLGSGKKASDSNIVYVKLEPGCQKYLVPVKSAKNRPKDKGEKSAVNFELPLVASKPTSVRTTDKMTSYTGMDIYTPVTTATLSRTQERAELQQLNDRFAAYVQRVRILAEKNNQVDSSAIIKSTKAMEIEIHNLKNMYEQELEKHRKELESCNLEKTTHQVQVNKQLQYTSELQDRLNVETDKNGKLLDEINNYQRRLGSLEAEIQDLRIAATRPQSDLEQLRRDVSNLTRENETWKHRYEHEQVARQEAETKIQQLMQKAQFNDKVSCEQMGELHCRIESSAATILSLEAKIRDLSKTDVSVSELLKQVRDTAEAELRKFQIESEEQYNRNLTALKAQLDNDAKAVERLETERTQLRGSVGELQARIRSLEGQVANLEHQKQTLEDAIAVERNRAADSAHSLERKLREVQDMLVVKMREVTSAREQNIPLKAEIEALKALLEEEEKRLKLTLMTSTSTSTSMSTTLNTALNSTLSATLAATLPAALPSAVPTTLLPLPNTSSSSQRPPSSPRPGLRVPLGVTSSTSVAAAAEPTSFVNSYNIATTAIPTTAASTAVAFAAQPSSHTAYAPLPSTSVPPPPMSPSPGNTVTFVPEARSYVPSPPLSVTYIPDALQTTGAASTGYDASMFMMPQYEDELDPQLYGYTNTAPLAKYSYETTPTVNRLAVEPSPPTTPRSGPGGSVRAKSAPVERQRNLPLVSANLGQGHDYFDQMFHDLQRDTLYSKGRPKSSPQRTDRPLSSLYHDYTVSTSSATGDMKIFEVHQDGKYVRLLNDGVQELEFGGFMLQQNVGGHPVAVYRFPPRTKFAPNSTITVYAGCNDHKMHNPPEAYVWKEQQKWGTGPECTTILCRPNGQAVAWTTAAHRFTRDAFQDGQSEPDDDATRADEEKQMDEVVDDESLTEINVNVNGPKPDPIYLRREKQQPPSLQANKHPHGNTASAPIHPHSGQARPYRYGNDNSSNNRQSRSQTTRPDPVPGQPYAGAAAQKMGSAPLRKYVSGVSTQQSSTVRSSGKNKKNFLNYLLNDSSLQ